MTPMCESAQSPHPPPSSFRCLPPSPPFFLHHPPSSPPPSRWPEGAGSSLDAGALLWALIDYLCAPHSQSGQSAWGPGCLPYQSCKKTRKQYRMDWKREFIKACPHFLKSAVVSSAVCPSRCFSGLLVLLAARDNQWCTQADFSCLVLVLVCLFSAGDDPFTALHLYLSSILTLVTPLFLQFLGL